MEIFESKVLENDNNSKKKFSKFLTSEKKKKLLEDFKSTIKEIIFGLMILGIILLLLFAYSGLWPPIVLIESDSMMHGKDSQIGTMDTGDLILSKKVDGDPKMIKTYVEGKLENYKTYGTYGDVISFWKNGDSETPIIHRALVWIEYNSSGNNWNPQLVDYGSFDIPSLNLFDTMEFSLIGYKLNKNNLTINLFPILENYKLNNITPHGGFITKGDNNANIDQISLRDSSRRLVEPIKMEWVIGKAEGEIPWLGLFKLYITGQSTESGSEMPKTSIIMFWICFVLIILILLIVHFIFIHHELERRYKKEREEDEKAKMFIKLIENKRKAHKIGNSDIISKQEIANFSENELLKYLENMLDYGVKYKESVSKPLTIYDLKELTRKSDKTDLKAQLKERLTTKLEQPIEPEPTKSYISTLVKPIQTIKRSVPIARPVNRDQMLDIFNLFLELEMIDSTSMLVKTKPPLAKPVPKDNLIPGRPLAPMAKPVKTTEQELKAKPIAKPVKEPSTKIEAAPMAQRADSELLDELLEMLD